MSVVEILSGLTEDRQVSWFQSFELRPGEEWFTSLQIQRYSVKTHPRDKQRARFIRLLCNEMFLALLLSNL